MKRATGGFAALMFACACNTTPPTEPLDAKAVGADRSAVVSWSKPKSEGSSTIIRYTVTVSPGDRHLSDSDTTSLVFPGLTNGTEYLFTVTATNLAGTSPPSMTTQPVTPAGVPPAPAAPTATAADGRADVTFTAPADTNGAPLTGFIVESVPPESMAMAMAGDTHVSVGGLTNGHAYAFTVKAVNRAGASAASGPSNMVTPARVPDAAAAPVATAGHASASVTWVAPANGGIPLTQFVVTSTPPDGAAMVAGDQTSAVIAGLTDGTAYTFKVRALNAMGAGPDSPASNAVMPLPRAPAPTTVVALARPGRALVQWTPIAPPAFAPVTHFTVRSSPPGGMVQTTSAAVTRIEVPGLMNGIAYTFTVTAANALGDGPPSVPSSAVTPKEARCDGTVVLGDEPPMTASTHPVTRIAIADLDEDGQLDVVGPLRDWGFMTQRGYWVQRGLGGGRFAPHTAVSTPATVEVLQLADMNGDGHTDLLYGDPGLHVSRGNGDGTFAPSNPFIPGGPGFYIATADFDRDGQRDVLFGRLFILRSADGGYVLSPPPAIALMTPFEPLVGDFNGDFKPDLVVANDQVQFLAGAGNGQFTASMPFSATGLQGAGAGDLDGDGKTDLVLAVFDGTKLDLRVAKGTATGLGPVVSYPGRNMYPLSFNGLSNVVSIADFDGDGRADVAVADDSVEVYLSDVMGGLKPPFRSPMMTFEPSPILAQGPLASLFAADFDADGKADVAVASTWGLQIKRGDGTGRLLGPKMLPSPGRDIAVATADFNGDRAGDVVALVSGAMTTSVALWLADGWGSLSAPAVYPLTSGPQQIAVGDVTGDGAPDVVLPTLMAGRIDTLVNARDGGLLAPVQSNTVMYPEAIALGDLDEDGKIDLVISDGAQLQRMRGNGDGTFQLPQPIGAMSPMYPGLLVGHLDTDNHLDIVVGGNVQLATAAGVYGPVFPVPGLVGATALADFDGDGKLDILGSSVGFGAPGAVWTNQGGGAFADRSWLPGVGSYARLAGDLTGDGRPDLVGGAMFRNDPDAGFVHLGNLGLWFNHVALDLEGDEQLDLVALHRDDLFIYRRTACLP